MVFTKFTYLFRIMHPGNMREYGQWSRKTAALIADRDANSHISVVYSEDFQISGPILVKW